MILFECLGMIRPLDTATLARCRIIPFFGRERYDSWILEYFFLPMDRAEALNSRPRPIPTQVECKNPLIKRWGSA